MYRCRNIEIRVGSFVLQRAQQRQILEIFQPYSEEVEIEMSADLWARTLEQVLLVILIVGRWLLPKGNLTRDQLSQLLLVYIGMAADIVELFESFKEDQVIKNIELTYVILGIWTWSLLQFTLVLTATKARKARGGASNSEEQIPESFQTDKGSSCCCDIDIWAILTSLMLQDGPFLCLRLLLILHYNIFSYMNIFFTCKNSLLVLLQLYRLYVVISKKISRRMQRSSCSDLEPGQTTVDQNSIIQVDSCSNFSKISGGRNSDDLENASKTCQVSHEEVAHVQRKVSNESERKKEGMHGKVKNNFDKHIPGHEYGISARKDQKSKSCTNITAGRHQNKDEKKRSKSDITPPYHLQHKPKR
ncbi:Transmembrane protein 26 [Nymphon striatum]|nr:Transmembrane protein 26 [Nymphon striatum]